MKILLFLALAGTAVLVLPAMAIHQSGRQLPTHSLRPKSAPSSLAMAGKKGTLAAVRTAGRRTVAVIREEGGVVGNVSLAGAKLLSRDRQALTPSELRIGDGLQVLSKRRIVDTSQHLAVVRGVVSTAPETDDGPMVVVSGQTRGVVADPSSRTRYADLTHQTADLAQISDSDLVTLDGVVDDVVDEMTQVTSISRLGPARHPGPKRA